MMFLLFLILILLFIYFYFVNTAVWRLFAVVVYSKPVFDGKLIMSADLWSPSSVGIVYLHYLFSMLFFSSSLFVVSLVLIKTCDCGYHRWMDGWLLFFISFLLETKNLPFFYILCIEICFLHFDLLGWVGLGWSTLWQADNWGWQTLFST